MSTFVRRALPRPARRRRILARGPFALVAGTVLVLLLAVPALAHAELVSSDPADAAVLSTPPTTITLTFSDGLDAAKSSFTLSGSAGEAGTGTASEDGATTMTLGGLALAPDVYTIKWTSVATDGDVLRGTLTFTLAGSTATIATPSASAPSSSPASPSSDGSSGADVLLPIVLGLVLVGVIGVYLVRRSRRA